MKPTGIRIVNKESLSFKMGQKVTVECHVYGSKPPPKVSWFNGSEELESQASLKATNHNNYNHQQHQHQHLLANLLHDAHATRAAANHDDSAQSYISEINRDINNNLTKISYLTLVPQLGHNQQQLTCSASNPKLPNSPTISDSITMNVQCK